MDGFSVGQGAALTGVCDLCRTNIAADQAVYGQVRDSSFAHPTDPQKDGMRRVTACSVDHLADLQQLYRERPFVKEELWEAKIDRAMQQHHFRLSNEQLVEATGLNLLQIEAAARWRLGFSPPESDAGGERA
ncbi:hypothetical protein [Streptomyces sp. NPDC096030]|uniref:hypothetical protein n=1 Tax=Streptomyces sp. NPDC096030 TaxID=3155423 RepID=UPI00332DA7A6